MTNPRIQAAWQELCSAAAFDREEVLNMQAVQEAPPDWSGVTINPWLLENLGLIEPCTHHSADRAPLVVRHHGQVLPGPVVLEGQQPSDEMAEGLDLRDDGSVFLNEKQVYRITALGISVYRRCSGEYPGAWVAWVDAGLTPDEWFDHIDEQGGVAFAEYVRAWRVEHEGFVIEEE